MDPFSSGNGAALLTGLVTNPSGVALVGTTVAIACPGYSTPVVRTTDSLGFYLAGVYASEGLIRATGHRLSCRLTEPATGTPRAQVTAVVGFAQGPVFLAKQRVDLPEQ